MFKNTAIFITTSVIIQISFFTSSESTLVFDCDPYDACAKSYSGYKVADPADCFSYYLCTNDADGYTVPSKTSFKCGEGYFFDPVGLTCRSGTTCTNQCLNLCKAECTDYVYEKIPDYNDCSSFSLCLPGRIKSHHKCPAWKPYFDGSECRKESYACCGCCDECTPFCKEKYVEVADPYDCRSYYICLDTGYPADTTKYSCDKGKYFEPSIGKCTQEHGLNKCKPKCG